ncbi:hypothetical protein N7466_007728 [Penicillium verhagenii]|uniref:uncharacterized protein n=1 Tax=Penicillium verhagenii TaxID=1562060 RepID=UPI002544D81B|nr:uncharacterized protein N7466_007728 [Penicillium verhagenii]KAJ5928772.1 hypothetical protein N7466_007728 [Penicillium verhagenii]
MSSTLMDQSHANAEERKLRKRLQNRLNQRARITTGHRLRDENDKHDIARDKNTYQIRRWRIDPNEPHQKHMGANLHKKSHDLYPTLSTKFIRQSESETDSIPDRIIKPTASAQSFDPNTALSADQLLHLIQFNAYRGLYKNKALLGRTAISLSPGRDPQRFDESFPTFSVVLPRASDVIVPGSLAPTQSQMRMIHSTWINTIPFPAMRDNLIKWEGSFNHAEFAMDVVGYLMDSILFPQPEGSFVTELAREGQSIIEEVDQDDEITAHRNGIIIWGEPHRIDSWEATPGFLRKYAWAMQGCDEWIESSNRWRRIRGEEPLRFSVPLRLR